MALASTPVPGEVSAGPPLFGGCSSVSEWVSFVYFLVALQTALFYCAQGQVICAQVSVTSLSVQPCFMGGVPITAVSLPLLLLYPLLCRSCSLTLRSSSRRTALCAGAGLVCMWEEVSLGPSYAACHLRLSTMVILERFCHPKKCCHMLVCSQPSLPSFSIHR